MKMDGSFSVNMERMNASETEFRPASSIRFNCLLHFHLLRLTSNFNTQVPEPSEHIPLINCIMGAEFPPTSADLCLEMTGVTTTSPEAVLACAESEAGADLLHDLGVETLSLEPPLTGVPWLLFNGVR